MARLAFGLAVVGATAGADPGAPMAAEACTGVAGVGGVTVAADCAQAP